MVFGGSGYFGVSSFFLYSVRFCIYVIRLLMLFFIDKGEVVVKLFEMKLGYLLRFLWD